MPKNFDQWNERKKNLEIEGPDSLLFHEREIWWCSLGLNLGDEEDGKNEFFERPVLIVKKFNNRICWVLPMSTSQKENPYYHNLTYDGQVSAVILSQLRIVSVKRFLRFVRKISDDQFDLIWSKVVYLMKRKSRQNDSRPFGAGSPLAD
ncbi:MAG: type II toxin-antitoxin system PemK/MazF family toxin [Candidatus Paceibacterota bacterium]